MATLVDKQRAIFNPDQAIAFDTILESVTNNQGHLFFFYTASGYGEEANYARGFLVFFYVKFPNYKLDSSEYKF